MKQHGGIRIPRRPLAMSLVAALSFALLASAGRPAGSAVLSSLETTQTIPVKSLQDGHAITGSKAKLHRNSDGLDSPRQDRGARSGVNA